MIIITILITIILETQGLLSKIRQVTREKLEWYIRIFTNRAVTNQRQIRYSYLFACLPVTLILGIFSLTISHYHIIYFIVNTILFILSVEILTWKNEAAVASNKHKFIHTYAVNFFAALFWYLILPSAIGSICYMLVMLISREFKSKGLDLAVYNIVVDKMLFYINIVPFAILYLFIAIAGDFEEVSHYIVEQRKALAKSFYFLENTLNEALILAIGKNKFHINSDSERTDELEMGNIVKDKFDPQITTYLVAILYRTSLFFLTGIALGFFVSLL